MRTYNLPTNTEVIDLIKNRPASLELKQIATDTGVSESWISKFVAGKIKKPGYNNLMVIVNYLTKK